MLPLGAEVQVKRMLIACRVRNVPLGAEVQTERMLTARGMRNTLAWSRSSGEENANSTQEAERTCSERGLRSRGTKQNVE